MIVGYLIADYAMEEAKDKVSKNKKSLDKKKSKGFNEYDNLDKEILKSKFEAELNLYASNKHSVNSKKEYNYQKQVPKDIRDQWRKAGVGRYQ